MLSHRHQNLLAACVPTDYNLIQSVVIISNSHDIYRLSPQNLKEIHLCNSIYPVLLWHCRFSSILRTTSCWSTKKQAPTFKQPAELFIHANVIDLVQCVCSVIWIHLLPILGKHIHLQIAHQFCALVAKHIASWHIIMPDVIHFEHFRL